MARCRKRLGERVTHELLQAQVEVGTGICRDIAQRARELAELRGTVARTASEFGMAMIAASTHPFANWRAQRRVDKERYIILSRDMEALAAAHGDLRHARPRRHRGRPAAHRPDEPGDLLPAASAGALDLLAVLDGPSDRPQSLSAVRLRRPAAQRAAGVFRERRGMEAHAAPARADRPVRRRHQDLVGPAAERALPDPRDAGLRRLHPARGRDRDRRALAVDPRHPLPPARRQPDLAALSLDPGRGEQVAGPAPRHRRRARRLRRAEPQAVRRAARGADRAGRGPRRSGSAASTRCGTCATS